MTRCSATARRASSRSSSTPASTITGMKSVRSRPKTKTPFSRTRKPSTWVTAFRRLTTIMSPVHIPRGFTKAFISGEVPDDLSPRIEAAHRTFAAHDVLLIEGTGHAGVGAVVGLSNAEVAARLGAPLHLITAWNPYMAQRTEAENAAANAR